MEKVSHSGVLKKSKSRTRSPNVCSLEHRPQHFLGPAPGHAAYGLFLNSIQAHESLFEVQVSPAPGELRCRSYSLLNSKIIPVGCSRVYLDQRYALGAGAWRDWYTCTV